MESDEQQRINNVYNRILRAQMNMAVNPLMNATTNTAGQGSIFGAAYSNQAQIGNRQIESMFDYNRQVSINVISADNGFILNIRPEMPGALGRVLVANTIEELRDLITTEMVTRKLEK